MAQHSSFTYPYSPDDAYYDHNQPGTSPLRQSPWKNRELPGPASFRHAAGLGLCHDNRPTLVTHAVPAVNIHRAGSIPGLEGIRLSPLSPRNSGPQVDPVTNWIESKEEPWSSIRFRTDTHFPPMGTNLAHYQNSLPNSNNYRHGPSSVESNDTVPTHSDSGYGTAYTYPTPVMDQMNRTPEMPDLSYKMDSVSLPRRHSHVLETDRRSDGPINSRDRSRSRTSQRRSAPEKCLVPGCNEISKCPSDAKKHRLKHEKPFHCDVRNCKRTHGFTTINDLNRHKKSVHKIGGTTKSYKCVASHCKNRDKEWPRLDNFKQHVVRMHPDDDLDDIIRRSECRRTGDQSRSLTPQQLSIASMDKSSLVAGMDDIARHPSIPTGSPSALFSPELGTRNWDPNAPNPFEGTYSSTSRRTGSTYPSYEGGQGFGHDYADVMSYKVSPLSMEPAATSVVASSGLNTLAAAVAVASTVGSEALDKNEIPDVGNRTGEHLPEPTSTSSQVSNNCISNGHNPKDPETATQTVGLSPLAKAIAQGLMSCKDNDSLAQRILTVLTDNAIVNNTSSSPPAALTKISGLPSSKRSVSTPYPSPSSPIAPSTDFDSVRDALTTILKCSPPIPPTSTATGRSSLTTPYSARKNKHCSRCKSHFARACELRKHERRHQRPYGCTHPKCHKKFGSKSDWKRHENSQHFQNEGWRCEIRNDNHGDPIRRKEVPMQTTIHEPVNDPAAVCGLLFDKRSSYLSHLSSIHRIPVPDHFNPALIHGLSSFSPPCRLPSPLRNVLIKTRIGRNYQSSFWCGFCRVIVPLNGRRADAWDERFNHIDAHFTKEGKGIGEWWCVEERRVKGQPESNPNPSPSIKNDDNNNLITADTNDNKNDNNDNVSAATNEDSIEPPATNDTAFSAPPSPTPALQRKHSRSLDEDDTDTETDATPRPKRPQRDESHDARDVDTFCCRCKRGPFRRRLYSNCMDCEHEFCVECEYIDHGGAYEYEMT
ncbi:hypothetical protein EJ05DRAFT_502244 [Pseudovirgaria hyperparasitica]|uniref:C2H2-type domain-containing protein n=1 Tax=Pseudovirgaria hyperparasitica TaxID=470096 RepID=A0A6A6W6P5_9PEZI|nr:uncharacterized protein EJ05DRAFT_502244 [Pseudovirgaria hyperparasitica]KAF2756751.1 hypothetical protein EJ05DRAFT_502244 [Pseudovirgaria hyperparasitica]